MNNSEKEKVNIWTAVKSLSRNGRNLSRIIHYSRDLKIPITSQQERVISGLDLDCGYGYNRTRIYKIFGILNKNQLEQAIIKTISNHEALRTNIIKQNNQYFQVVNENNFQLTFCDLSGYSNKEVILEELKIKQNRKIFNLEKDNPIIISLVKMNEEFHCLIITVHQILFDGNSWDIFHKSIESIYNEESQFIHDNLQYADYAHWQLNYSNQFDMENLSKFWSCELSEVYTSLFTNRTDFYPLDQKTKTEMYLIDTEFTTEIRKFCQEKEYSLFLILLTAIYILIFQLTHKKDIILFTATSGRTRYETRKLIGLFTQIFPIRVNIKEEYSVEKLLNIIQEKILNSFSNQDLGLNKILEFLKIEPGGESGNIFNVQLVLQPETSELKLNNLVVKAEPVFNEINKFDLSPVILECTDSLKVYWQNRQSFIPDDAIQHLHQTFREIVYYIIRNPDLSLNKITLNRNLLFKNKSNHDKKKTFIQKNLFQYLISFKNKKELSLNSQILQIWRSIFSNQSITLEDNFFRIGGNSIIAARLFTNINKVLNVNIPLSALIQAPTPQSLAEYIKKGKFNYNSSLVSFRSSGTRPPFFLIHPQGGGVLQFEFLASCFSKEQPFYAFKAKGLEEGMSPYQSIEEMANHYISEMKTIQPEGPYFIGGMCVGGIIALEMVYQLESKNEKIEFLGMIGATPPVSRNQNSHYFFPTFRYLKKPALFLFLVKKIFYRIGLFYKVKIASNPKQKSVWNAVEKALLKYEPKKIKSNIIYFTCEEKHLTFPEYTKEWSYFSEKSIKTEIIKGHHYVMLKKPFAQELGEKIQTYLLNSRLTK